MLVLNKLDLSDDAYFWMIGDNPKADIFGAKQLKATTFQKIHNKVKIGENKYTPDYIFDDYSSLLKFIKNLFK